MNRRFPALIALAVALAGGIAAWTVAPVAADTTFATPLNNVSTVLAADHASGSGTIVVRKGDGAQFGSPTALAPVRVTVASRRTLVGGAIAPGTTTTIFLCTGRSGDTLTGLTAAEGTADRAYLANDLAAVLVTAGTISEVQEALADKADDSTVVKLSGSYANPGFVTSLAGSKISGNVPGNAAGILGAATTPTDQSALTIACWGDSLTNGYGSLTTAGYRVPLSALLLRPVYNGGVNGETSGQVRMRMVAATDKHAMATIIWVGRNGIGGQTSSDLLVDVAAMVTSLSPGTPYLIPSILNASGEPSGSANYIEIAAKNAALAGVYGSHYIDVRTYLVSQYDPAVAQDVIDHANDIPPSSLRFDFLHLTDAGYSKVANYLVSAGSAQLATPTTATVAVIGGQLNRVSVDATSRALDSATVHRTGNESIAGDKTFTDHIGIATPADAAFALVIGDTSQSVLFRTWTSQNKGAPFGWNLAQSGKYIDTGYGVAMNSESDGGMGFYLAPSGNSGTTATLTRSLKLPLGGGVLLTPIADSAAVAGAIFLGSDHSGGPCFKDAGGVVHTFTLSP